MKITFEYRKMPLCNVKNEPPSGHVVHVEMTFECSEVEPLSDMKEESIIETYSPPRSEQYLPFCPKTGCNVKQDLLEEEEHGETKHTNTVVDFGVKVESILQTNERDGSGGENVDLTLSILKSSLVSKNKYDSVMQSQKENVAQNKVSNKFPETHMPLSSDYKQKVFDCTLCGKLFHSLETRRKHSKIHIKDKLYECDVCSKTFALHSYLKRHKTIHISENEKLNCEYCLKKFSDSIRLRQHQNQVHFSMDRKFQCNICSKMFKLEGALKSHIQTHSGVKPHACDICNSKFSTRTTLIHHQKIHTNEKQFKCSFCGKRFLRLFHLQNHTAVHTGKKAFQCKICDKLFGHASSLRQHQLVHTGQRFACTICGKTYSRPAHMRLHVARAHTKIKKYTCEVCSEKFYTTGELLLHIRAHIGEKPFGCKVCKKAFVTSFRRDEHHSQVHTDNKRYQCEACGKQYHALKRLKGHIVKHRVQENEF